MSDLSISFENKHNKWATAQRAVWRNGGTNPADNFVRKMVVY